MLDIVQNTIDRKAIWNWEGETFLKSRLKLCFKKSTEKEEEGENERDSFTNFRTVRHLVI